jgi:hypothetical protein
MRSPANTRPVPRRVLSIQISKRGIEQDVLVKLLILIVFLLIVIGIIIAIAQRGNGLDWCTKTGGVFGC